MPRSPSSPSTPRRVGIREVAARAGVSVGSASRVINGAPDVAPELRERVQAAVAELGFTPNHAARSLRLRSTRTIGCLFSDVSNPLYAHLFHALEARLRAAGYLLLLANGLNGAEREVDLLSTFAARGMDGVILAPGNESDERVLQALRALGAPVVVLDRDMAPERDRVLFDHELGMQAAVAHLLALGHRRIALVLSRSRSRPMRSRFQAFRAALGAAGVAVDESLVVELATAVSSSHAAVSALLERPDRPTALLVLGTSALVEALNAVAVRGLQVPRDLSLVSIGDPAYARHLAPALSVVRVDLARTAELVVTLLLDRLQRGYQGEGRSLHVAPELVLRASTGPVPA